MDALHETILPRAARLDVGRPHVNHFKKKDIKRIAVNDKLAEEFFAADPVKRNSGESSATKNKTLETDFENKLADIPWERQPGWIVDFVMFTGWQNRQVEPANFPDEDKILEAFKLCMNDTPNIAQKIARCQRSITPPTYASKLLLDKMM